MSGTSLDGIDIAVTEILPPHHVRLLGACCMPFSESLRDDLLALCRPDVNEIYRAGIAGQAWARLAAKGVKHLLDELQLTPGQIATVGSHGQTVRHHPEFGFSLQIGAPALLAELTGICVISDFRSRDIAAGGEGAPLVPAFHDWLLRDPDNTRTLVNVGGFANLTIMRPGQPATGFDSGPGNVLLDYWIHQHQGKPYDHAGDWARSGQVLPGLLDSMLGDDYFQRTGPKSTGREYFNPHWLHLMLEAQASDAAPEDVQATLVELSAHSIGQAAKHYADDSQALYLCGGGARNSLLIERIAHQLPNTQVLTTSALGVDPDWMEAMAFAWLAWRCDQRQTGNLPAVTGAAGARILGAIYPA
tara:strand:- start:58014 stop:59093 length:1080 start_codon:yes stop_codon:yes gene_type:complete